MDSGGCTTPNVDVITHVLDQVKFDTSGLIPTIAQDWSTGMVLMLAWMNAQALRKTLETRRVCYWSRSRQRLWRKGELSGQVQLLRELRLDCDGDAILLLVQQAGVACHTGRAGCFHWVVTTGGLRIDLPVERPPEILYATASQLQPVSAPKT